MENLWFLFGSAIIYNDELISEGFREGFHKNLIGMSQLEELKKNTSHNRQKLRRCNRSIKFGEELPSQNFGPQKEINFQPSICTWRIIPVSKWLTTPFMRHLGHAEGGQPQLGDFPWLCRGDVSFREVVICAGDLNDLARDLRGLQ